MESIPVGITHGGRLIEARHLYPDAPAPFLDLSTGINPYAYPLPRLLESAFTRLPESEQLWRLQAAAARAYGASDPEMVVAAPGTQILISLLPYLLRLPAATILGPTYGEYQATWTAAGAEVRIASGFEAFAAQAASAGGAAILCNPNNPDGRVHPRGALLTLRGMMARQGGVLIVDEAFADLEHPDPGLAASLPAPGLLILRSFGKSYGLAGLRLGFLIAEPDTATRLRAALGPWAVSGPALAIGSAALDDAAWRERTARKLRSDCDRLDAGFAQAGFAQHGGTRLFRLFRDGHAQAMHDQLARQGILTRRFADRPDLLRVGLPGSEACWARLLAALSPPFSSL